jgi:DNA polymerase elongation subunit (family B)
MKHILVIDIETIALPNTAELFKPFEYKVKAAKTDGPMGDLIKIKKIVNEKAALSPVISRVACIGVTEMYIPEVAFEEDQERVGEQFFLLFDENEKVMIQKLADMIKPNSILVTYNGMSFDFPYLTFRACINDVEIKLPFNKSGYYAKVGNHIDMAVYINQISKLSDLDDYSFKYMAKLDAWCMYFGYEEHKKSIKNGEINILDLVSRIANGDQEAEKELRGYSQGDLERTVFLFKKFMRNLDI